MNIKKLLKITLCCCLSVCLAFSCWNAPIKAYAVDINTSNNNAEVDSNEVDSNEVEASDNPQKSTDSKNNENSKSTATPNTAQNNTDLEGLESSNKSESKNINKKPKDSTKSDEDLMTDSSLSGFEETESDFLIGKGTSESPFCVYNYKQLCSALKCESNVFIELACDINFPGDEIDCLKDCKFSGSLDGKYYTITSKNNDLSHYDGHSFLYELCDGAKVSNLNLDMTISSTDMYIGILAGQVSGKVDINNCSFNGTVYATYYNKNDYIIDGTLMGWHNSYVGGCVGYINSGSNITINNCKCGAEITSEGFFVRNVGGFVGYSEDADITMTNCETQDSSNICAVGSLSVLAKASIEIVKYLFSQIYGKYIDRITDRYRARNKAKESIKKMFGTKLQFKKSFSSLADSSLADNIDYLFANQLITEDDIKKVVDMIAEEYIICLSNPEGSILENFSEVEPNNINSLKKIKTEDSFSDAIVGGGHNPLLAGAISNLYWTIDESDISDDFKKLLKDSLVKDSLAENKEIDWDSTFVRELSVIRAGILTQMFSLTTEGSFEMIDPSLKNVVTKKAIGKIICSGLNPGTCDEFSPRKLLLTDDKFTYGWSENNQLHQVELKVNRNASGKWDIRDAKTMEQFHPANDAFYQWIGDKYLNEYKNRLNTNNLKDLKCVGGAKCTPHDLFEVQKCYANAVDRFVMEMSSVDLLKYKNEIFNGLTRDDVWTFGWTEILNRYKESLLRQGYSCEFIDWTYFKLAANQDFQTLDRPFGTGFTVIADRIDSEFAPRAAVYDQLIGKLAENNSVIPDELKINQELSHFWDSPDAEFMKRAGYQPWLSYSGDFYEGLNGYISQNRDIMNLNKWSFNEAVNIVKDIANELPSSSGGNGEIHWNSYAGGMIGIYEGSSDVSHKVIIENCKNNSTVTGGHAAGGIIGDANHCCLEISNSLNTGVISVTDYSSNASAAGILGAYKHAVNGNYLIIKSSFNRGSVMSRCVAGGIVGHLYDGDLNATIDGCSSAAYIAGVSYVGGVVAWEDSISKLNIWNCCTSCMYDMQSFDTTCINFSWIPILGLPNVETGVYSGDEGIKGDNHAGSILGCIDDVDGVEINNCYYQTGYLAFGENQDSLSDWYSDQIHERSRDEFENGAVTYSLNHNIEMSDSYFGQVVDDLSKGKGCLECCPVPGSNVEVFKDELADYARYTNFNPRYNKLYQLHFNSENVTLSPNVSYINVVSGTDFEFKVSPNEGYETVHAYITNNDFSEKTEIEANDLINNNINYYSFTIKNIQNNMNILISTEVRKDTKPEGNGTFANPYKITNKYELAWLNQNNGKYVFANSSIEIMNDIDCSGLDWKPMFSMGGHAGFSGELKGNGFKLTNFYCSQDYDSAFFAAIDGGTVRDLTIEGKTKTSMFTVEAHNAHFENCTAAGSIDSNDSYCGGFAAIVYNSIFLDNCTNNTTITQQTGANNAACGGFVGILTSYSYLDKEGDSEVVQAKFSHLVNNGTIFASDGSYDNYAGGIVGYVAICGELNQTEEIDFEYCTNNGNIGGDGNNLSAGGIVGCVYYIYANVNIYACVNNGSIGYDFSGKPVDCQICGGLVGWWYDGEQSVPFVSHSRNILTIDYSINYGNIWTYGDDAGGFIGTIERGNELARKNESLRRVKIFNSASIGYVSSNDNAGSILGAMGDTTLCPYEHSICFENIYFIKYENVPAVGGDVAYGASDIFIDDKVKHTTEEEVVDGTLCFKINRHKPFEVSCVDDSNHYYDNDIYGQVLDSKSDSKPCPLYNCNNQKVYRNWGYLADQVEYTNLSSYKEDDSKTRYKLNLNINKGGELKGYSSLVKGEDNLYKLIVDPGYQLKSAKYNGEQITLNKDNEFTINPENSNNTIDIVFDNTMTATKDGDCYLIDNLYKLNWFAEQCISYPNLNAKFTESFNIVGDDSFTGIGSADVPFEGKITSDKGIVINNLTNKPLINVSKEGCVVSGVAINCLPSSKGFHAGLINQSYGCEINDCCVSGQVSSKTYCCAGFVAYALGGKNIIKHSINQTNFFMTWNFAKQNDTRSYCSGFVALNEKSSDLTIENCINEGVMYGDSYTDSIVAGAVAISFGNKVSINGFTNKATLFANFVCAGVLGRFEPDSNVSNYQSELITTITHCISVKQIESNGYAGGILGQIVNKNKAVAQININNCETDGDIVCNGKKQNFDDCAGGILAYMNAEQVKCSIYSSLVLSNKVFAKYCDAGGIAAYVDEASRIDINYCAASIQNIYGDNNSGLLLGHLNAEVNSFENCYFWGGNCTELIDNTAGRYTDGKGYTLVSKTDFNSGAIANLIGNNSDSEIGQYIDFDSKNPEANPHIGNPKVYINESSKYSNYDKNTFKEKCEFQVRFVAENGSLAGCSPNSFIDNKKENYTMKFSTKENAILEKLSLSLDNLNICVDFKGLEVGKLDYTYNHDDIIEMLLDEYKEIKHDTGKDILLADINASLEKYGLVIKYKFSNCFMPKGTGDVNSPFEINNAYELNGFSNYVNNQNNKGINSTYLWAVIKQDIDMSGIDWTPIGNKTDFVGSIDGEGHKIKNLKSSKGGLIKQAWCSVVKNLDINVELTSNGAGCSPCIETGNSCLVENVKVDGKVNGKIGFYGGIIAWVKGNNKYTNTKYYVNDRQSSYDSGTRVYDCESNIVFESGLNEATNESHTTYNSDAKVGGIVGLVERYSGILIDNTANKGNIASNNDGHSGYSYSKDHAAGILAWCDCNFNHCAIWNTINSGNISGDVAAGILGTIDGSDARDSSNTIEIKLNKNTGHVEGNEIGGMIGSLSNAVNSDTFVKVSYSLNLGNIIAAKGDSAGGMLGHCNDGDFGVEFNACGNVGKVEARDDAAGGIVGYNDSCAGSIKVNNSYNIGPVHRYEKESHANDMYGWDDDPVDINNCYYIRQNNDNYNYTGKQYTKLKKRTWEQFANGSVAYELSSNGANMDFGQIINDRSLGEIQNYPDPINKNKIYQIGDNYSNFDCESIKITNKVTGDGAVWVLDEDFNSLYKVSSSMILPKGSSFKLLAKPNDGASIIDFDVLNNGENLVIEGSNLCDIDSCSNDITISANFAKYIEVVPQNGEYHVSSYSQLLWVAKESKKNSSINVVLDCDIKSNNAYSEDDTYKGCMWPGIGSQTNPYTGYFDGRGHVIEGISCESFDNDCSAFILNAEHADISNFKLKDIHIKCPTSAAGVVYKCKDTDIKNVDVSGEIISSGRVMGGIAGCVEIGNTYSEIRECNMNATIAHGIDKSACVAGICSQVYGKGKGELTIEKCTTCDGEIYSNAAKNGVSKVDDDYAAGFVGRYVSYGSTLNIKCSTNRLKTRGNSASGFVAEYVTEEDGSALIYESCNNYGYSIGDKCGGFLGKSDSCTETSYLSVKKSINSAMIGGVNTVLRDAGGIFGEIDDGDLIINLDSVFNFGPVLNTEDNCALADIASIIGNFGLSILSAIPKAIALYHLGGPVLAYIDLAIDILSSLYNLVWDFVSGRYFVLQYAGGICGHFDNAGALSMTNVINFGVVRGETYANGITYDDCMVSGVKYNNVYTLDEAYNSPENIIIDKFNKNPELVNIESNKSLYTEVFGHEAETNMNGVKLSYNDFVNGGVAYIIQHDEKSRISNVGNYGQVIDDEKLGDKMTFPSFDFKNAVVHYNKDMGIFTNYDPQKYNDNKSFHADIEFNKFINSDLDSDTVEFDEKSSPEDLFTVKAVGSRTSGLKTDTDNDKNLMSYNFINLENSSINIKPNNKCTSIFEVQFKDCLYNKITYTEYLDNGSRVEYYCDKSCDLNTAKCLPDAKVSYNVDGTVDVYMKNNENNNFKFVVNVVNGETKVADFDNDAKNHMMYPWNSKDSLPKNNGYYYLTDNVELNSDAEINNCTVGLSLNGNIVSFNDNSQIKVSDSSVFEIIDTGLNKNNFKFENGEFVKVNTNSSVDVSYDYAGSLRADKDNTKSMIKSDNSKVFLSRIDVMKSNKSSVLSLDSNESGSAKIDCSINKYSQKQNDAESIELVSASKETQLILGPLFDVCEKNESATVKSCDIKFGFNKANAPQIEIADNFVFENPITLKCSNASNIMLVNNMDRFISDKINIKDAFVSLSDNNVCALSAGENNVNDCYYVSSDNAVLANIKTKGTGNIGLSGDVYVKAGDSLNCSFNAAEGSLLDKVTGNKESLVQQDKGIFNIKNIDKSNDKFTFVFDTYENISLTIKGDVQKWNETDTLPTIASDILNPVSYKLMNDVVLNDAWVVPEGAILIDLNGHNITTNKTNVNLIKLDNEKSSLTIIDSSKDTKNYIQKIENENKTPMFNLGSKECDFEIDGGCIGGANFTRKEYYKYNYTSGAILALKGRLNINHANIVCNNSLEYNGGSAITVGEQASVVCGKNCFIGFNTMQGCSDYDSSFMSAGIASKGVIEFNGQISNNWSDFCASSAVSVSAGSFTNDGFITNNTNDCINNCRASKVNGTIFNEAEFINNGEVTENLSGFENAAVVNLGHLTLGKSGLISNNTFMKDGSYIGFDLCNYSKAIDITNDFAPKSPCLIKSYVYNLTNDWDNSKVKPEEAFKLYNMDGLSIKVSDNNELKIA